MSTKPKFTGGHQRDLGEVDWEAAKPKANDPARFVPKKTLADGRKPSKGLKVVLAKGDALAKIVDTYQLAAKVALEEGVTRVIAYSRMSAIGKAAK
jgi:hypothetical protein